jgi:hypothetical protein
VWITQGTGALVVFCPEISVAGRWPLAALMRHSRLVASVAASPGYAAQRAPYRPQDVVVRGGPRPPRYARRPIQRPARLRPPSPSDNMVMYTSP